MDRTDATDLPPFLAGRYDEVAAEWQRTISQSCYIPLDPADAHRRLVTLLQRISHLVCVGPVDADQARQIGVDLAGLHCIHSSVPGETLRLLSGRLLQGLPAEQALEMHPRLMSLLDGLLAGYFERALATVLDEQEQTTRALVSQLRATRDALCKARDGLEQRVVERTADLARANDELRREVADRERAEQAALASEERWRSLVQNAPDTVLASDREGRVTFVSRVAAWTQSTPQAFIGRRAIDFLPAEWREVHEQAMARVFETGESVAYEVAYSLPDGSIQWRSVHSGPIWHEDQVVEALLFLRDVSEQKRAEEMKDNLIRDVSHEMRSPLAKVQMSLELLGELVRHEQIDGTRVVRISDLAYRNVQRLLGMVEGVLDLSRLEASTVPVQWEIITLHLLVNDVLHFMRSLADVKGLALGASLPDCLPAVKGDREKLFRVLVNLVDNAIKFSEAGRIVVSARADGEVVELAVADQGLGIRPENLGRVFDRFFQERPGASGVGVGLTICRNIVEFHGGRIWAESAGRGQGATFYLTVPLCVEEE